MIVGGRILVNVAELGDGCTVEVTNAEDDDDVDVVDRLDDVGVVDGLDTVDDVDVMLSISLRTSNYEPG